MNNKTKDAVQHIVDICSENSRKNLWWEDPKTGEYIEADIPKCLMLIVSELSEALEGDRKDLMDEHLPHRKMFEVELADALIRIGDLAGHTGIDLAGATAEKLEYNNTRADHKKENRLKSGGKKY